MAFGDATVRGSFELSSEQAVRSLRSIRDAGASADAALQALGYTMDRISMKRITPRIDLTGFDRVNAQLSELEARLDRLDRRNASARVSVSSSGGIPGAPGVPSVGAGSPGGGAGGGGLGGIGWRGAALAGLAPFALPLAGGATALAGSAVSAALGAGTVGLGGAGALVAGGGLTYAAARPAIAALTAITTAQTKYTTAVQEFGRASSQAATAHRALNEAMLQNPAAAGAARQVGQLRAAGRTAFAQARGQVYRGISGAAFNVRGALPALGAQANVATAAVANAGIQMSQFLTQPQQLGTIGTLSGAFASNLPIAERSLEHIATILGNLSTAALPFFTEANTWVMNWTGGLAQASRDTPAVQARMNGYVSSAKDWARLTGAAFRTIRDIFQAGAPTGDSMVKQLTSTMDRWDQWINQNPQKVQAFFKSAETTTTNIASAVGNLAGDLAKVAQWLDPIVRRASQLLAAVTGLGPVGTALITAGAYGAYGGARGAAGGLARLAGAFVLGSPGPLLRGRGAAGAAGGLSAAEGVGLGVLGGGAAARSIAPGLESAFAKTFAGVEGARFAGPVSQLGRAGLIGGLGRAGGALTELGGAALAGAARFALPALAITSILQGLQTRGGAGSKAEGALQSFITAGGLVPSSIVPADFVKTTIGGATAGASLGSPQLQAAMRGIGAQANAVRTPQQLQAFQAQTANVPLRFELSPGDQAKFQQFLTQASTVAARNAGVGASNAWSDAFTRGLQAHGPNWAANKMSAGITAQLHELGPKGGREFAAATAQWVGQMERDNPKLQKPLDRVMGRITDTLNKMSGAVGDTFAEMQRKVFYFNGQILTGSQTTWGKIHDALVNPASRAQEQLAGIFGLIQGEAVNALVGMGYTRAAARSAVTNLSKGGTIGQLQSQLTGNVAAGTPTAGATPLTHNAPSGLKHERGGMIGGSGLLDTVGTPDGGRAAPGEAYIANRHTMSRLSSATLAKYGKTAWQMIRDEQRPHSAPMYATGGSVQSQHPELHAGIAQAVQRVLDRFPLSITSTTSGTHADGSYHYLGEAADIAGTSGLMYQAAQWIKASGLGGALTEGIHNPNLSVKNQHGVPPSFWGPAVWAEHLNHIHMAVAGALGAGGFIGGGARGAAGLSMRTVNLRAPRGGPGIPGLLVGQAGRLYAGGLSAKINQATAAVGGGGSGISAAGFSGGGNARANMALGQKMMLAAGWGMDQWPSLAALWNQESGWNQNARNPSSGAFGIPQALGHGNIGNAPAQQIAWGLNYIRGRYGSPAGAWAHERANNWYATGGKVNWAGWNNNGGSFVTQGPTLFGAGEGGRERVNITPVGQGGGHNITVHVHNPNLQSGADIEQVAREVAGRILDALDSGAHGSDRQLAGAA